MIELEVLGDIAFHPNLETLKKKAHIREGGDTADRFAHLVQEAEAIARPRALYGVAYVDSRSETSVVLHGIVFESRVLQVNLEKAHRVFPFLATCGTELQTWMDAQEDMLERYYSEMISEMALRQALGVLQEHLDVRYRLGRTSTMSPGSLEDWPIEAQQPLFALLGDPETSIGVRLTESLLMIPIKSVSGIRFPTERTFASCQLCPREACPNRQAPYDGALYRGRYQVERVEAGPGTAKEKA